MVKSKGHQLNVRCLDRHRVKFDFTHDGERVRGIVTIEALTAIIRGEVDNETNLAPSASPMMFPDFASERYLEFAAKPRLPNLKSLKAERDLVKALGVKLGKTFLHEVRGPDLERLKALWLEEGIFKNTVKRRLNCLRRVIDYAVATGLVIKNPLPPVRGLGASNRSEIWLTLVQIDKLLERCHKTIKPLVLYLLLTGARIQEALDFRVGDLRNGKLYVPTEKRRMPSREFMREFNVASLGPRFAQLMAELKPHPTTGHYFFANKRENRPLSYTYFRNLFTAAKIAASLPHIKPHDLRGTFAIHRAMIVKEFRQLQVEMGHKDARSIESYLARATHFDPRESIFFFPQPPKAQPAPVTATLPPTEVAAPAREADQPTPTPLPH